MLKMIKDFFVNMMLIGGFILVCVLIISQCGAKDVDYKQEYKPSEQQPTQQPAQHIEEDEGVDMLKEGQRNSEFWGMMIPAL